MQWSALDRMTRLVDLTAALSKTMTPNQVAEVVLTLGLDSVGARGAALLRVDEQSGEYVLLECNRTQAGVRDVRLPLDSDLPIAKCAKNGAGISSTANFFCLPLLIRGHAIGAVALEFDDGTAVGDEQRSFLEATADQCAQALERARLYALEQIRREELERSNRLKDDFLGIVSHELRTPLSAILGWARMLKRGMLGSAQARERALAAIERNATLQARLVDDLLDVSRIVSGKLELETAQIDMAAVIDAALDSVRPALVSKELKLCVCVPAEGVAVVGDARRLQQVVWNLLTNAIKFSTAGGRVDVYLEKVSEVARIRVMDEGVGIPADVLPHVFDRFKQADGSATREHGGLGLGLSIVRHVVEAHGGTVEARSDGPGRGAELRIDLPVSPFETAVAPVAAEAPPIGTRLRGMRILLVDDDGETRDVVTAVLEVAGAEVRSVGSAQEALATVIGWQPEVIVSDIAMPEEDGYALIRKVRELPGDLGGRTPAVALTAMARPRDRVRALAAGFQTHLPKPIDPSELVLAVANLRLP
ncbi:MAG: ATP-binding protein [Polyangiaceae bacterium]|jgi:signal transduction histidine kinase